MPRYDPPVNQFIVPDDPYAVPAHQPPKPKHGRTISALERLAVFTEVTQRVKRRLRNVIAGAVGASSSTSGVGLRAKRKSQDAMNVDSVWNGWHAPTAQPQQPPIAIAVPMPQPVETPELPLEVNRFSVVMKDNWSVSDLSMHDGEESGTPTPRATTPEPTIPKRTTTFVIESYNEEDELDEEAEDGTEYEGEEDEEEEHSSSTQSAHQSNLETSKQRPLSIMSLTPMDEDPPATPRAPTTSAPQQVVKSPKPTRRHSNQSARSTSSQQKTPTLASRTSSTESSPPKTPKLTLQTNFNKTPVAEGSNFVLAGLIDHTLSNSPVGLGLGLSFGETPVYGRQDSMDVVLPTALFLEQNTFDSRFYEGHELQAIHLKAADIPSLLPAAKITEKKIPHKPKSRRGSVNTEPPITCTSRRAAILVQKRNASKTSLLNGPGDQIQDLLSNQATLRAQIDALPTEQAESPSRWKPWLYPQLSSPFSTQRQHLAPQPLSLFTPPTHTSNVLC